MMKKLLSLLAAVLFAGTAYAADLSLDGNLLTNSSTVTGVINSATLNNKAGVVTTPSLTTPVGSMYTFVLSNTVVATNDLVFWSVANGTNASTNGILMLNADTTTAGAIVFKMQNGYLQGGACSGACGGNALTGTLQIRYLVLKP